MMSTLMLLLHGLILLQSVSTIKVSYTCQTTDGGDFKLVLRLDREGDTDISGVKAYADDGSGVLVAATPSCETTALSGGVYEISMDIHTGAGDCGVTGINPFDMIFRAEGTIQYYEISCNTASLLQNTVASPLFQTNAVGANLLHRSNPLDAKLQVVEADGSYVPTNNVYLGQDVKLRLILNKGGEEFGPDNMGYIFHTAVTKDNDPDAEFLMQIFTPGLGTEVKVEGRLAGHEFTYYAKVKRDDAVQINIPTSYADETTSDFTNWVTTYGGIKVTSFHDRIGVKVIHRRPGTILDAGRIVLPDSAIETVASGSTYVYSLHITNIQAALCGIVAFEDATTITINYNGYSDIATQNVNGEDATGPTDDVSLDEFQVFVMQKGNAIEEITLEGDKPFAVFLESVFATAAPDKGVGLQFLPKHNAAERFVLPFPDSYEFRYEVDDPVDDQGYSIENPGATLTKAENSQQLSEGNLNGASDAMEIFSANPVLVHGIVPTRNTQGVNDRAGFVLPSIEQWSPRQYFYAEEGRKYDLHFVSYKGHMADIKIKLGSITTSFVGATLGDETGFTTSDVTRILSENGQPPRYEYYGQLNFEVTDTDNSRTKSGLVEFQADPNRPFMLIIFEKTSAGILQEAYLPFGLRYPPINPCTATASVNVLPSSFAGANSYFTKPGDLLDNDCDGYIDEEILNGEDDDGDGNIDEDLTLGEIYERGVKVKELFYDTNVGFTTPSFIIDAGCQQFAPITTGIGHFTLNTDLSDVFDDYWVIETNTFSVFKETTQPELYFGVTYEVCYDGDLLTTCAQPTIAECAIGRRKRRESTGYDSEHFATIHVRVNQNKTNKDNVPRFKQNRSNSLEIGNHSCTKQNDFWLSVYGLVAIILLELFMIGGMLSYKRHVIKSFE